MEIKFGNRTIGLNHPTYFIADIAANHDGDLERAKLLIRLGERGGSRRGQIPELRRAEDRFRLWLQSHERRAGQSSGIVEEIRV